MLEFLQFCFKDNNSGACTVIVLIVIFYGITEIINAIKGNKD